MQIFLIDYNPIETAKILDHKRLNKQVLECDWILNSTEGSRVRNHPIYNMYKDELEWVKLYRECLAAYRNKKFDEAEKFSHEAMNITPAFLNEPYFNNFKRKLYIKDPVFYEKFYEYGGTTENWYFIDGQWYIYDGGRIGEITHISDQFINRTYY